MKALVLSFDKGEELRPLTITIPKGLLPVANIPVLERNIIKLKEAGITEIGIVTGHLGHKIKAYFENGTPWGVNISYFPIKTEWKSIFNEFSNEPFLVIEGEWLSDAPLESLIQYDDGLTVCGKEGAGGVYVLTPDNFEILRNHITLRDAVLAQNPIVFEWVGKCNRLQSLADYLKANLDVGTVTGRDCIISENARLLENVVLGSGVTIDDGVILKNSVIMDNVHIGKDCEMDNAIIAKGALIKNGTFVFDLGVVGEGAKTGYHSFIKAGGYVLPFKIAENDCTIGDEQSGISTNISISNGEISGSIFGEITPETGVGIGKAVSYLKKGLSKGIGWDGKEQTRPLYLACLSGLMSSGGNIINYGKLKYPCFYNIILKQKNTVNIYISTKDGDGSFMFFNEHNDKITVKEEQDLMRALKQNLSFALNGLRYKISEKSEDYIKELLEYAVPTDKTIYIDCKDCFASEALCMYKQDKNADICFCLNKRMNKMNIKGLSDRQMQLLFSVILNEETDLNLRKRAKEDGIFCCVLVLNYMERNKISCQELLKKTPNICVVKRELPISFSTGRNKEYKKDGGRVLVLNNTKSHVTEIIAEGYNEEYAEDLADYYVRKILDGLGDI